jgi:pimeloyl-ACP methyl ester carboxylesterase
MVEYFGKTPTEAKTISEKLRICEADWKNHWRGENYNLFINLYSKNAYRPDEIAHCQQHPLTCQKFMTQEFSTFDLTADLHKITCPVLYLAGQYDWVHPPICSEHTATLMTHAAVELHVVENTGDPVYRDQPQIAQQLISKFLAKF